MRGARLYFLFSVDAVSTRFIKFLCTTLTSGCSIALSVPVSAVAKRPYAPDRLETRYCAKARRAWRLGSLLGQWSLTVGRRSASNVRFSSLICFEVQLDIFFFRTLGSIWRVPYYTGAVAATWRPASCIMADRISAGRLASRKLLSCLLHSRQQLQVRAFGCSKGESPL